MNLTKAQIQAYDMERVIGGSIGNTCGIMLVNEPQEAEVLKKAVNVLYERNDTLRTKLFVKNGEVSQCVQPYAPVEVEVLKFENKEQVHEYSNAFAREPLDIDNNLVEIKGFHSKDFCGLLFKLHHVISDGWTASVLSSQFYNFLRGEDFKAYSYSEYVESEKKYLESKRYSKDIEYFVSRFNEKGDVVLFDETEATSNESKRKTYILNKEFADRITTFANEHALTPYTVFLTIISLVYSKLKNNAENFYIGTPVLNRTGVAERNTVGMFVNTVPFLVDLKYDESFIKNADKTTENVLSMLRHQKCNYVDILKEIKDTDVANKWYDVLFSFQVSAIKADNFESEWYCNGTQTETLQIHIDDYDCNGVFRLHYDYQIEKFTEDEIDTLHQRLMMVLCDVIENPEKPLNELEYLTEEEKEKVIFSFNDTALEYPKDKGVYKLFEKQAEKTPDKPAVVFKSKKLTYSQLKDEVCECADRLCSLNIKAKDIVAVHLERSQELIVFQLAILKIGAVFLPVDKRYPVERIQQMCDNCKVSLLISDELDKTSVDANVIQFNDFSLISLTDSATTVTNLEDCYIIYTSGSTGVPKGCLLTGKGLLNFCMNNNTLETLNNIENPIFACVNSASFDYFIAETLLPLTNGFTTVVLDDTESTMQEDFLDVVAKNNINVIMTTPTRLKIYFNDKYNCSALKNMACICTSGEPLTADLLEQMYKKSPEAQVYNPIGPSECSVWDMGGRLEKADGLDIHIGKPIANAQIYIVDKYLKPTPIGVTGEICIAGDGVGSGYINNPELTAEKFVDNPFGEGKLYKSGDLGYWRNDGNICYVGRNDFQVKVRGLRIELGEIESELEKIDGVECAVVIVHKDNQDHQFICAFYTGKEIEVRELRSILSSKLPRYMVPHIFTHLEEMPMTASGKLDRKALPEIDLNNISTDTEYVAPETEEEKALAVAIEEVLGTERVSMEDNFFNVGGDSISAIYIVSVLEEMGYELHVADIMQSDTFSDVAKAMKSTSNKAKYEQEEVNGYIPYSPIMRAFLKEEKEIPKEFIHTCIVSADCDEETVRKAIEVLISHHDMLRGTFTENGISVHPTTEREVYSFSTIDINDTEEAKEYLKNTKLAEDKLVKVVFCKTEKETLVGITVHHFLIDLVSWEVLVKDFRAVVEQIRNNEEIILPAKTASFKLWSEELKKYAETMSEENRAYWKEINNKLDNAQSLSSNEGKNKAEEYSYRFAEDISEKLINEANNTYGTRTNEVLLTALGLAAGNIAGGSVGIIVEGHGRTELDRPIAVERTVGWFTSCYPVVINNSKNIAEELVNVKETMRRIPKNGIEYLLVNDGFHINTDIIFNFYKTGLTEENNENEAIDFVGASVFPGKINVNCLIIDNTVMVNISVPESQHKANISEELGKKFVEQTERIVDVCTTTEVVKTRSDFSDDTLTESELDELKDLFDWTDDDE